MIYDLLEKKYLSKLVQTVALERMIAKETQCRLSKNFLMENERAISMIRMINKKGMQKSYEVVQFEIELKRHLKIVLNHGLMV